MSKKPENHRSHWTPDQVQQLQRLTQQNTPTRVLGLKLGRTPDAVASKASDLGLSLKPTNQRPYNRHRS